MTNKRQKMTKRKHKTSTETHKMISKETQNDYKESCISKEFDKEKQNHDKGTTINNTRCVVMSFSRCMEAITSDLAHFHHKILYINILKLHTFFTCRRVPTLCTSANEIKL